MKMEKQLVRKGVFETNSSSSHSLSIATEDKEFVLETIYPDQNGEIVLNGGEYGWGWFRLNGSLEKANYVAQALGDDERLVSVIKEVTGADIVTINNESGYIDHDSHGIIPTDREGIKNLIFNRNSWIFGGNDNQSPDPMFYDVPEIKDNKQILPQYKYELKIEGCGKSTKFKQDPTEEELEEALTTLTNDYLLHSDGEFMENSWELQLSMRTDIFKIDHNIPPDLQKKEIYFLRKHHSKIYEIKSKYKKELDDLSWGDRGVFIRNKMISENPEDIRSVNFSLNELK